MDSLASGQKTRHRKALYIKDDAFLLISWWMLFIVLSKDPFFCRLVFPWHVSLLVLYWNTETSNQTGFFTSSFYNFVQWFYNNNHYMLFLVMTFRKHSTIKMDKIISPYHLCIFIPLSSIFQWHCLNWSL